MILISAKWRGSHIAPLDVIGNRLVHMCVLCTFTISCIITYQSVVHCILAWGLYGPLPYVCYKFCNFIDPSFKHSGRNIHLSADSGNSSCYSSVHKFDNTSIADVGSVLWLLTVWLWVVIIDKAFCFYYVARGPFVCPCTTVTELLLSFHMLCMTAHICV
jgi:hypothetical protein